MVRRIQNGPCVNVVFGKRIQTPPPIQVQIIVKQIKRWPVRADEAFMYFHHMPVGEYAIPFYLIKIYVALFLNL